MDAALAEDLTSWKLKVYDYANDLMAKAATNGVAALLAGTRREALIESLVSDLRRACETKLPRILPLPDVSESELENEVFKLASAAVGKFEQQANSPDFKTDADAAIGANVERLAKLSPLEYDKQRKTEAKKLGVRPATLDSEVFKARSKRSVLEHESLAPPAPEPWPDPIDGLALLNNLHAFLSRFIVIGRHALTAVTLWIVFTYLLDVAEVSPRLAITSPTKRCGKTLMLELLSWLVFRPISCSNLSPSAIFRTIDLEQCSLLLDEVDALPRRSERTEEIRGLLNSGHTRTSAYAIRNIKSGDDWIPKKFSTWAAIMFAAIGDLMDTWADRSIAVPMMRKPRNLTVERLIRRNKRARAEALELTRKIARWVADHKEALGEATPELPPEIDDRACDNWELLLAIAHAAGGEWPEMARKAAVELSGSRGDGGSIGEQLIVRLNALFGEREVDRLSSVEICDFLATLEGEPWAEYGRNGKPITQNQVARLLRQFHVAPRSIRIGDKTPKGYLLAELEKVFDVYVMPQTATAPHRNGESGSNDFETATHKSGDASDPSEFPNGESGRGGVADRKPEDANEMEI